MRRIRITDGEIKSAFSHPGRPALLCFTTEWSGPCMSMSLVLQRVKRDFAEAVTIVDIDIDLNSELIGRYNVKGAPTFILIRNGHVAATIVGSMPYSQFDARLKSVLFH